MDYEKLAAIPLFSGITEAELPVMLGCVGGIVRDYEKNESVLMEQDSVRSVGVILSGSAQMIQEDIWGSRTILAVLHQGDIFGESFVYSGTEQSRISVIVTAPSEIMLLPFMRIIHTCGNGCSHHRKLTDNMIRLIAEKNIRLIEKTEIIAKKTLREKIMTYLSLQSQRCGSTYFEIPLDRTALAEYLCADRSALSRELAKMKDEGLIDYHKSTFRLLNVHM